MDWQSNCSNILSKLHRGLVFCSWNLSLSRGPHLKLMSLTSMKLRSFQQKMQKILEQIVAGLSVCLIELFGLIGLKTGRMNLTVRLIENWPKFESQSNIQSLKFGNLSSKLYSFPWYPKLHIEDSLSHIFLPKDYKSIWSNIGSKIRQRLLSDSLGHCSLQLWQRIGFQMNWNWIQSLLRMIQSLLRMIQSWSWILNLWQLIDSW